MLVLLIFLLIVIAGVGILRALVHGNLTLVQFDGVDSNVPLGTRPWLLLPTDRYIGIPGQLLIVGIPFTRRVHIWIRCPGRPQGDGTLRRGGQRYISGIWVTYDAENKSQQAGGADPDTPEQWNTDI